MKGIGDLWFCLGRQLQREGKYERAEDCLIQALKNDEMTFGAGHIRTGIILDALGDIALQKGDADEAIKYYKRALWVYENTLDLVDPLLSALLDKLELII